MYFSMNVKESEIKEVTKIWVMKPILGMQLLLKLGMQKSHEHGVECFPNRCYRMAMLIKSSVQYYRCVNIDVEGINTYQSTDKGACTLNHGTRWM
jgi:hypothetical protein